MAIGIGTESYNAICVNSDVDYYRYKYRDYEEQIDGSRIDVSFVSPVFSVYERYKFCLLKSSHILQMKNEWMYRPDYISYEYYNTTAWWQLIMWINDVKSIEYFNIENVIVPTQDAVTLLQNESYSSGTYIDINEDKKHFKTLFSIYKPAINSLNNNKFNNVTLTELTSDIKTVQKQACLETFVMDIPTLRLRYVDLKNVPIESSLKVIVEPCIPILTKDKHYSIVQNSDGLMSRLTWDPKIINNAGLLFKLREKNKLIVKYDTII